MTTAKIVKKALSEKRTLLSEVESKDFLKDSGINIVPTKLAKSREDAIAISKEMGFPVVMKIASPDIVHKSDLGGVKTGIRNSVQAGKAYDTIIKSVKVKQAGARIQGISVQKMAKPGVEVIIGMSKDAQFGPVLMFGLGGILVELMKDVSFRITPLSRRDAAEMIKEIKGYPLLTGFRGSEPVNIAKLEEFILKISDFVEKHPEIKELDLNPIFASKDGAIAVDARVILEDTKEESAR